MSNPHPPQTHRNLSATATVDGAKPKDANGPADPRILACETASMSTASNATLAAPSSPPQSSIASTIPACRQVDRPTAIVSAPPAWRHIWPTWSHSNSLPSGRNSNSHYVAISSTDDTRGSDSDSDLEDEYGYTPATRRRRCIHPKRHPLDHANQPSGWRTCGMLLIGLLLLKSLLFLALLTAILFTLGPLARHHHGSVSGDERVAQLEINSVLVHNWTQDAYADPVANVDLSAKMLVTGDGTGGHDVWWAEWVRWVDGHVQVGAAQYEIWLENPLQPIGLVAGDATVAGTRHFGAMAGETNTRLINKVLDDVRTTTNPHEPPTTQPVMIGTALAPAFRPRLSTNTIDASIQDTSVALDPQLLFKWLSPFLNLGSEAPPMKLRLIGSPKVSVGWVGKPFKVVGLAKIDAGAAFRADYDWQVHDIRFDPGTLLTRHTLKSTAALLAASADDNDKDKDDPPVPTEYLLRFTLTFLNQHPLSAALPLALSTPIYSHDEQSNDPLAYLVGEWLDGPGLVIPGSGHDHATLPMTLRIPTTKLPKVFSMLQQYHRGERVSVQLGPGSQMTPSGRLAGVVSKAHGIVSVQKGRESQALGLDAWVARAGRSIVERVVEWGQEHLVGGAW